MEEAQEMKNSFDFWQNLRVHGFLMNLVLICNPIVLFPCVEYLPSWCLLLLLEVSKGETLGDFHTTGSNHGGGGHGKYLV